MPVPQVAPEDVAGGVNCMDDTFLLVRQELLAQDEEIKELQAQVENLLLQKSVAGHVAEAAIVVDPDQKDFEASYHVQVSPDDDVGKADIKPRRVSITEATDNHKIHVAFYEFDQSMWDAGLLLCFHHTGWLDKFLLSVGVVVNLVLQMSMLFVVEYNMLENPWTPAQTDEMLKWRVSTGHKIFFPDAGQSLVERLCQRKLWNFEQEVYNELYDYLSKPVPGVVLSVIAIFLWILTIMMEYRKCVEQALAVWHLPTLKTDDEFEEVTDDGEILVRGISNCLRAVAFVMLVIPRLLIMGALAISGSIYVAQTASLSDIVLNCLALAFVLDVDELVANVLLTEKLRGLLTKIQPITCGMTRSVRAPFQDVLRIALTLGGVLGTVLVILLTFRGNVESAAVALCGGNLDFSYTGGVATDPSIVLMPAVFGTDKFHSTCPETTELVYLQKYYLPDLNSTPTARTNTTIRSTTYWESKQLQHVWDFALHPETGGCPLGHVRVPPRDEVDVRECVEVPQALWDRLKALWSEFPFSGITDPGRGTLVQSCPRFSPSSDCAASATLPEACHWSWLSEKCDSSAPGQVHVDACEAEGYLQCETWAWFNVTHPRYNCKLFDLCGIDGNCGVMTGDLTLSFPDIEAALNNISAILTSTKVALANLTSTTEDKVKVRQASGSNRRLANTSNSSSAANALKLSYEITELPVTVFPEKVVQQTDALISAINVGLKEANLTAGSAQMQPPQTITYTELIDKRYGNYGGYGDGDSGGGSYGGGPYGGGSGDDGSDGDGSSNDGGGDDGAGGDGGTGNDGGQDDGADGGGGDDGADGGGGNGNDAGGDDGADGGGGNGNDAGGDDGADGGGGNSNDAGGDDGADGGGGNSNDAGGDDGADGGGGNGNDAGGDDGADGGGGNGNDAGGDDGADGGGGNGNDAGGDDGADGDGGDAGGDGGGNSGTGAASNGTSGTSENMTNTTGQGNATGNSGAGDGDDGADGGNGDDGAGDDAGDGDGTSSGQNNTSNTGSNNNTSNTTNATNVGDTDNDAGGDGNDAGGDGGNDAGGDGGNDAGGDAGNDAGGDAGDDAGGDAGDDAGDDGDE